MANRHYTEFADRKISSPSKGVGYPAKGNNSPAMPYRCPDWGLKGLPTQSKDRSQGVKEVPTYAKWEGLSKGGPRSGKVGKVMHEYKEGTLHSGSKKGPMVKSREQAMAIAMSEAGMSKKHKKMHK